MRKFGARLLSGLALLMQVTSDGSLWQLLNLPDVLKYEIARNWFSFDVKLPS